VAPRRALRSSAARPRVAGQSDLADDTLAPMNDVEGYGPNDLPGVERTMASLATRRPVFHSEANFQHAFAWELQRRHEEARIRLETRPRPGVRLTCSRPWTDDGLPSVAREIAGRDAAAS